MSFSHGTNLLLLLWRRLTLLNILGITLLVYAIDWATVVAQFHEPGLMMRMLFVAQLLSIEQCDGTKAADQVHAMLAQSTQPTGPLASASATHTAELERETIAMATTRPTSTDYADAFRRWSSAAANATKPIASRGPIGLGDYFWHDKYLEAGAGGHTFGGVLGRRADAILFLDHYRAFERFSLWHPRTWSVLADVPTSATLRPWQLHRFYDRKHFELCDHIPLAIASLLLANSFLLRFLFADYDAVAGAERGKKPPRHFNLEGLWAESVGSSPFDDAGNSAWDPEAPWYKKLDSVASRIFASIAPYLPWCVPIILMASELVVDRPETVISWPLKLLAIGLAGMLISVAWITIARLRSMRLEESWLAAGHRPYLSRVLRPFTFGIAAMLFVTVWAGAYSAFALMTSREARAIVRGLLQLAAASYTIYVMWQLVRHLNRQLNSAAADSARPGAEAPSTTPVTPISSSPASEPRQASDDDHRRINVLSGVIPGIEEVTVRAILLALIPLPEIIKLFG